MTSVTKVLCTLNAWGNYGQISINVSIWSPVYFQKKDYAVGLEVRRKLLTLLVEEVGKPLQKEHAEDVFLVLRGIHFAAQIVTGTIQETGELAEGEFGHRGYFFLTCYEPSAYLKKCRRFMTF